jgi:histone-binding protein RBBP4
VLVLHERSPDDKFSEQKLLIGTHTSDSEQNCLMVAKVRLSADVASASSKDGEEAAASSAFAAGQIDIVQQIVHEGEVNRSVCPQCFS